LEVEDITWFPLFKALEIDGGESQAKEDE